MSNKFKTIREERSRTLRARAFFMAVKAMRARENKKTAAERFKRSVKANEIPSKLVAAFNVDRFSLNGYAIHTLSLSGSVNPRHLVYLHGGAYVMQAVPLHWQFIHDLAQITRQSISFVQYPLAPESNHLDAVSQVLEATAFLRQKNANHVLQIAGDSAGAGLAMATIQELVNQGLEQPYEKAALISPWLNVPSLHGVSTAQIKKDIVLDRDQLLAAAAAYADGTNLEDPRISPMLGSFKEFPEIGLWMGGCDLFDIDVQPFLKTLEKNNVSYTAYLSKNMIHDYPIMPIPEGKQAVKQIASFLSNV